MAYHTAWLKAHYPVHFMAALLTNDKGNTDKLVKYINECREMEIEVLPPDVSCSGVDFTVEGSCVRFGLSAIKNVGEGAIRSLIEARGEGEGFRTLHELCAAIDTRQVKQVINTAVRQGKLILKGRDDMFQLFCSAFIIYMSSLQEQYPSSNVLFLFPVLLVLILLAGFTALNDIPNDTKH